MKIRCPKCSHVIQLDIPKIPTTGIEVNCPSCSARFRLRGKEESPSREQATPPPASATTPNKGANHTGFPAPAGTSPSGSAIFGGSGLQSFADDLEEQSSSQGGHPTPTAQSAGTPQPTSPSSAPAAGAALDGLADLLQELDDLQAPNQQTLYQVRGQRGNVFGPFDANTILNMLNNGQLNGREDLTLDGTQWQPMQNWPEFSAKVSALLEEQKPAAQPAEPPTPAPTPAPTRTAAAPVVSKSPEPEEPPPSPEDDPAIRRIERKAPQRIRSALKDEVMEAEGQRSFSMDNLKQIKENLESIDRKWFILGGVGLGSVVLLSIIAAWLFGGPKTIHYKNIDIPLERPFAQDSYSLYTKQLLPRLIGELKKQPQHPQLQAYLAVSLGMYLEYYGPNESLASRLAATIKGFPPSTPERKPTFLEEWAKAMQAIVKNQGGEAWKYAQHMKKLSAAHYAVPYVEAKALALRGLSAQAMNRFKQAASVLSAPVRVNYARGLLYLRTKKPTEACQAFYQTTILNKEHYPAFLSLLELEQQCSAYRERYTRIWKEADALSKRLESSVVKSRFSFLLAQRATREKKPNLALRHLLAAIRLQPTHLQYQELLPDFYLATYDYNKTLFVLRKIIKRPGNIHPRLIAVFLQVLFRTEQSDEARRNLSSLLERCPRCKEDHDVWLWRARIEENTKLENQAINSLNEALFRKPKSVAALAAKARVAWKANHPKMTKEILEQVKPLVLQTFWDRVNLAELYLLLKQTKEAYDTIEPLLVPYPRDEYIHRMAGSLLLTMERYADAEKHFRQALQTWSKDDESIQGLATSLDAQKKYKDAIPYFQKSIAINPNLSTHYYRLGRSYYMLKDYQKAAYTLRQSLEREDRNAEAHYFIGLSMEALGETDNKRLEEHFLRATKLAQTNLDYQFKLAQFYRKTRQINNALDTYQKLLDNDALKPEQRLFVLKERGQIQYDLKNWSDALQDFQKLYKLDPQQSIALRWIADCYLQMNRTSNAISWYQRALNHYLKNKPKSTETSLITPEMQRWNRELADVYGRLGDLERSRNRLRPSIKWYLKAVQTNPDAWSNHRHLGYLYKDLKQWGACIKHLSTYLKKAPDNDLDRAESKKDMEACQQARMGRY